MHPHIARLATPEECEQFALNVERTEPELARLARRRAVELRAVQQGANTEAEREALEAIYAYEAVLTARRGRKVRASRTWQMIDRHGIVGAVERAVDREDDPSGYKALIDMGMGDLSFESVVLRHRDAFSADAVEACVQRLARYQGT